ncbi:MAG: hypothetical protein LBP29_04120 [Treponema sp.]|jgi:hypothetical protein|nr:hypothetical protein [Treponema sp.]
MPKKIILLFFALFFVSSLVSGQESPGPETVIGRWQKALEKAGIPLFPGLYLDRIRSNWIGFGLLVNSTDGLEEDSFLRAMLRDVSLLQLAVLWRGKKINTTVIFSFEKNEDWGLSLKFSY